jgi:hypothetical protein
MIGVPWADSSVRCWMVSRIFSPFSLKCVDKISFLPCYLCFFHGF